MLEMEKLYYYIGQPKTENCLPKTKSLSYATQKNQYVTCQRKKKYSINLLGIKKSISWELRSIQFLGKQKQ